MVDLNKEIVRDNGEHTIEIDYCYIDDVLKERFDPEKYCFEKDKLDPDKKSKKLYNDLSKVLGGKIGNTEKYLWFEVDATNKCRLVEKNNSNKISYSADYIGPSCSWARKPLHFEDIEIGNYLKETRRLGGHMLWPVRTINTARGNKPLYDRIDLCLAEIQHWYERGDKDKDGHYCTKLWNELVKNKGWFKQFKEEDGTNGFKNFIDFYMLNDFVDDEYKVISLSLSKLEDNEVVLVDYELKEINKNNCFLPGYEFGETDKTIEKRKQEYQLFINNSIYAIKKRTKRMIKIKCY